MKFTPTQLFVDLDTDQTKTRSIKEYVRHVRRIARLVHSQSHTTIPNTPAWMSLIIIFPAESFEGFVIRKLYGHPLSDIDALINMPLVVRRLHRTTPILRKAYMQALEQSRENTLPFPDLKR